MIANPPGSASSASRGIEYNVDGERGPVVVPAPRKMFLHLSPLAAVGGCEIDCLRVIEGLSDCDHRVVVFDDRGPMSARWEAAGARVEHLSAWQTGKRKFHSALSDWAKLQVQPDGIFCWSISRMPFVLSALARWKIPCVVHAGNPLSVSFASRVRWWLAEKFSARPQQVTVVACSNHVAESLRGAFYFRHLPIKALLNPVLAQPVKAWHRDAGLRMGMVARLDRIKDHRTVLEAFPQIVGKHPHAILEFAGDGALRQDLEKRAAELGVAARVRFLGQVSDVSSFIRQWDIFIYSTTPSEGLGNALAEAMMIGLPCVVSDLPMLREMTGEDGALFFPAGNSSKLAEAVCRLVDDAPGRRALSLKASAMARARFDSRVIAREYLNLVAEAPKVSETNPADRRIYNIDRIAAVGDAGSMACWSGIPFHFGQAARAREQASVPWRLEMRQFGASRRWWNLGQALRGRGMGGYQYSEAFLDRAEASIPTDMWRGRVLTFNQHFPRGRSVASRGGRLVHYIDATFASLCTPGGMAGHLPRRVRENACAVERTNYSSSEWVVTMARWAAESAINDCRVHPSKVATILPGANLALPREFAFPVLSDRAGRERPLVLGFVGKDWKRKGLPFLLKVRAELDRMGVSAVVRCAGHCPTELSRERGLDYVGFIDKSKEPARFLDFLVSCDVGCLFSDREPLGISTLEFLRAGVPVTGFMIEGIADTVPPDAGFRFEATATAEAVAVTLRDTFDDEATVGALRDAARAWSPLVTWERCVEEWRELLTTGFIKHPVQLWRGLRADRP